MSGIQDDFTTPLVTEVRGIPMAALTGEIEGTHPQISGTAWGEDISLDGSPNECGEELWQANFKN